MGNNIKRKEDYPASEKEKTRLQLLGCGRVRVYGLKNFGKTKNNVCERQQDTGNVQGKGCRQADNDIEQEPDCKSFVGAKVQTLDCSVEGLNIFRSRQFTVEVVEKNNKSVGLVGIDSCYVSVGAGDTFFYGVIATAFKVFKKAQETVLPEI